jgi:hypothetical protein
LTIRFFLKASACSNGTEQQKVLYRFLQLQYIVTARTTNARVLQLIVRRPRKTWAGNSEQLELGGKRKERLTLTLVHVGFKELLTSGETLTKLFMHVVFLVLVIRCKVAAQFVGGQNAEFMMLSEVAHIVTAVLHCRCLVVFSAFDKQ